MKVAVLGASPKKERYSNQAMHLLEQYGHEVFPVNPAHEKIENWQVYPALHAVPKPIHTLSVYLGDITSVLPEILQLQPERIIFNPGTEAPQHYQALEQAGIEIVEGCTLVMLKTKQF